MAVTKIFPIRSTIQKSVDYVCNPDKTEGSLLIHSEHCVPQTAGQIFHHHINQCRAGGNTIGRHLIQSFAPDEVDPATAHQIGKRLAEEILGGRYAYVLATHVDRDHVHNHFIWGAADIVSHKRYRSNKTTYHEIRNISDRLCKEHKLSVIVPQGFGKSYAEWEVEKHGMTWTDKLKASIDKVISTSASFEDFIKQMEQQGYTIKRGKHIAFKAPDQERFTRAKRLGVEYTEDEIKSRIAKSKLLQAQKAPQGKPLPSEPLPQTPQPIKTVQAPPQPQQAQPQRPPPSEPKPQVLQPHKPLHAPPPQQTPAQALPQPQQTQQQKPQRQKPVQAPLPQQKPQQPKQPPLTGITLWESIISRKDTKEIYNLMQEHGGYDHFNDLMAESRTHLETIDNGIKANEERIKSLGYVRKTVADLNRTRKVYNEYKTLQKSTKLFAKRTADKFYETNSSSIFTHENALRYLKDYERPLPTLKELDESIDKTKKANVTNKKAYNTAKAELDRFKTVYRKLFDVNLEHKPKPPQKQKGRSQGYDLGL